MFLRRRLQRVLVLVVALALALSGNHARAAYPDRNIRIVVPFAPGGSTDVVARTLALEMAKDLGVSVIIENKPGAATIIGTQSVAISDADGYTLLMATFCKSTRASTPSCAMTSTATSRRWRWSRAPSILSWSTRLRRSDRLRI